jgi:hypothetical protein
LATSAAAYFIHASDSSHHQSQLASFSAMQHHSLVSSISSKEIDLARSRSGLFFVRLGAGRQLV